MGIDVRGKSQYLFICYPNSRFQRVAARLIACVLGAVLSGGCHSLLTDSSSTVLRYTTQSPVNMVVDKDAKRQNALGIEAFQEGKLADAEFAFRKALDIDPNFGPAHNNLGQLYLKRHQLYLAAWEFEYAASLMPELIEPIVGQGLAYEIAGRLDRAADLYENAYERDPTHAIAIASLVRARIKQDADPYAIAMLLDELLLHETRQPWIQWAQELRQTRYAEIGSWIIENSDQIERQDMDLEPPVVSMHQHIRKRSGATTHTLTDRRHSASRKLPDVAEGNIGQWNADSRYSNQTTSTTARQDQSQKPTVLDHPALDPLSNKIEDPQLNNSPAGTFDGDDWGKSIFEEILPSKPSQGGVQIGRGSRLDAESQSGLAPKSSVTPESSTKLQLSTTP